MGCVCCSLSSFISIVLHALERITLCTVCAMLVCCVLFTILGVLIMGVGIGFHYCEVQSSVAAMAAAAKAATSIQGDESRRSRGESKPLTPLRTVNQAVKRGFAHRLGRRDRADEPMPSNNNTINDLILGLNSTLTTLRVRGDQENVTLNQVANESIDTAANSNTATLLRVRRDLANITLNQVTNKSNDTEAYSTNDHLTFEYDELKSKSINYTNTNELSFAPASNISVHDGNLLTQNCTLLNFFTRYLQL